MWKKTKTLAACLLAAAWWGIFYPELCFTEDTCGLVQTGDADAPAGGIAAEEIMRASGDGIVISSRLLEWCEKNLFDRDE